jgi:hypothetical protein
MEPQGSLPYPKPDRCTMLHIQWTYLLTYGAEHFLRSCQLCSDSRNSQHFTEPKGSSSCPQESTNWSLSWARSIQSIPSHPISLGSILILSTHLRLGLPSGLFTSGFPNNILCAVLFSPFVLHALSISSKNTMFRKLELFPSSGGLCETFALLGSLARVRWLRLALTKRRSSVDASHPHLRTERDPVSEMLRSFLFFRLQNYGQIPKT